MEIDLNADVRERLHNTAQEYYDDLKQNFRLAGRRSQPIQKLSQ